MEKVFIFQLKTKVIFLQVPRKQKSKDIWAQVIDYFKCIR